MPQRTGRQTLEARLGQDVNWKENKQTAQGLSFGAVGFFVGAGVAVGASLVVYFVNRRVTRKGDSVQIISFGKGTSAIEE